MSLVTILHYILNYIALQPYFSLSMGFEYGLAACTRRTVALLPTVRIAQWLRYCRIMLITQKCHGMDAGARSYRAMEGE